MEISPQTETISKLETFAENARSEGVGNEFMNPGEPPKKKRGRPKGSTSKPSPEPEEVQATQEPSRDERLHANKQLLEPCFKILSEAAIRKTGKIEAGFTNQELDVLCISGAECIEQYLPNLVGKHANLIILSMTLGAWSYRVARIYEMEAEKMREAGNAFTPPTPPAQDPVTDLEVTH